MSSLVYLYACPGCGATGALRVGEQEAPPDTLPYQSHGILHLTQAGTMVCPEASLQRLHRLGGWTDLGLLRNGDEYPV